MRLYAELASWWHLLSPPEDHADEAAAHVALLAAHGPLSTLLELGSGGGHLAAHVPSHVEVVLTDRSEAMLVASRDLNPDREHVCADMRSLRLGRTFDAVLLHDAVMYLTSEADLRAAFATAYDHLAAGGLFLVVPDTVRDDWAEGVDVGGGERDGRAAQLLEWQWDPDPHDDTIRVDFALLLREADGTVAHVHDTHTLGLYDRATFWRVLRSVGFEPVTLDPWALPDQEVFLARRP